MFEFFVEHVDEVQVWASCAEGLSGAFRFRMLMPLLGFQFLLDQFADYTRVFEFLTWVSRSRVGVSG